jgi:hypothetical protein
MPFLFVRLIHLFIFHPPYFGKPTLHVLIRTRDVSEGLDYVGCGPKVLDGPASHACWSVEYSTQEKEIGWALRMLRRTTGERASCEILNIQNTRPRVFRKNFHGTLPWVTGHVN